ncbi:GIY-YIG nuclease family protein [Priestia megaterium]|uniref:GIY-YIG nuclease family protein n=1 Tax=Priestia megaterium TaxID=1404 RepID=UPI00366F4608
MIKITAPEVYATITLKDINSLRESVGGVYVFKDRFGVVLYVGKTMQFRKRLADHRRGDGRSKLFVSQIETIDLYNIPDDYEREMYETFFINDLQPKYNIAKVYEELPEVRAGIEEEIDRLEYVLYQLSEEKQSIEWSYFDDDEEFEENPEHDSLDDDYFNEMSLGQALRDSERLADIEVEVPRIRAKINDLRKKL